MLVPSSDTKLRLFLEFCNNFISLFFLIMQIKHIFSLPCLQRQITDCRIEHMRAGLVLFVCFNNSDILV